MMSMSDELKFEVSWKAAARIVVAVLVLLTGGGLGAWLMMPEKVGALETSVKAVQKDVQALKEKPPLPEPKALYEAVRPHARVDLEDKFETQAAHRVDIENIYKRQDDMMREIQGQQLQIMGRLQSIDDHLRDRAARGTSPGGQ